MKCKRNKEKIELSGNSKFDNIYEKCQQKVFMTALSYMKDYHMAEEIFQDTFMQFYMQIEEINSATAENWLLTVAKHKSINLLKSIAAETEKLGYFGENSEELPSYFYGNIHMIEKHQDYGKLGREIFAELYLENKRWYEAVVKVYCFGKPKREVAVEMGIAVQTLYVILYRARAWIKRHYGEQYNELIGAEK